MWWLSCAYSIILQEEGDVLKIGVAESRELGKASIVGLSILTGMALFFS